MKKSRTYAIFGGGVMGDVLFSLIQRSEPSARIIVCVRSKKDATPWKKRSVTIVDDGDLSDADVVLISVKPKDFRGAKITTAQSALIISVMAGVSAATISKKLGAQRVARIMMNISAKDGGSLAVWHAPRMSAAHRRIVRTLCAASGAAQEVVREAGIDKATVILGSGPAFLIHALQCLASAARGIGVPRKDALRMASSAFAAASQLLVDESNTYALITRIASKGGTTEAGLNVLNKAKANDIWHSAIRSAYARADVLRKSTE